MEQREWLQWFAQPEENTQTGGEAPDAGERQEDFEELIRGRYKADFDARVQKILDGRLRGLRQENQRLRQEALLRQQRQTEALARLERQEEQLRQRYPGFRGREELADPAFARLIRAGVEAGEAYEMVHRRELAAGAMVYAARQAAQRAAQVVAGGRRRPTENGGGCGTVSRPDPGKLSSRELADIRRRVLEGERISF